MIRRVLLGIMMLLILLSAFIVVTQNNENRTKTSESVLSVLWKFKVKEIVRYLAGDVDGDHKPEIIVVDSGRALYVLNGENGRIQWKREGEFYDSLALGDVDLDGKPEIIVSRGISVCAINGEDGSEIWRFRVMGRIPDISLGDVDGDGELEVTLSTSGGYIYVLDGEDGSLIWRRYFDAIVGNTIAQGDVDGDGKLELVFGDFHGYVYAYNGEDGSLLWKFDTQRRWVCGCIAMGDLNGDGDLEVIAGTFGDKENSTIFCLDGSTGSVIWRYVTDLGPDFFVPAIGDLDGDGLSEVVVSGAEGVFPYYYISIIYCLDGTDGSLIWRFDEDYDAISNPPALGDIDGDNRLDIILTSFADGYLFALNGENGSLLWRYWINTSVSPPILADLDDNLDLEIVVGNVYGELYALDVKNSGFRIYWQGESGDFSFEKQRNQFAIDSDMDFLSDYSEAKIGTDPTNSDTDGDGIPDGVEVFWGLDPGGNLSHSQSTGENNEVAQGDALMRASLVVSITTLLGAIYVILRKKSKRF